MTDRPNAAPSTPGVDCFEAMLPPATRPALRAPQRSVSGVGRSRELFRLFRNEPTDPDAFYQFVARDTVAQVRPFLDGRAVRAIDIGGGPGYTADAMRDAGLRCTVVEYSRAELALHGRAVVAPIQGDGQALPIASGSVDLAHSSNVLEHVPDPWSMLSEMARVLRTDTGVAYLAFTNWYSPWGGHETSPWHYLGGHRAARRYRRRHGSAPKNEYGVSLYRLHIAEVMRWFDRQPDVEVLVARPRYLPSWCRGLVRVPAVREVLTWNLEVIFRRVRRPVGQGRAALPGITP
jgi:SAM-dependent methyltransferase